MLLKRESWTNMLGVMTVFVAIPLAAATLNTGSISGQIVGNDGNTVAGIVSVVGAAGGRAVTGADGSFTIANLPQGSYSFCVRPNGRGYLDPCFWSPSPPRTTLTTGQAVTGVRVVLVKGAVVRIRVNDTAKLLDAPVKPGVVTPHVLLGVRTANGLSEPLTATGKDASGRDYEITIPLDIRVNLSVIANQVRVTDPQAAPGAAAGPAIPLKLGATDPLKTVVLNVSRP